MFKRSGTSVDFLAGVSLFEGFTQDELRKVAGLGTEVDVDAGAVIVDQGDPGLDCFVVVEGTASVYINGEHVTSVPQGTIIGEMALVDHRPRTATVVADTPMRLLRLGAPEFRALLETMPKASERVMTLLTARLKRAGG